MNQVNWVLDEFDSIHGRFRSRGRKRELLERATRSSIRGVQALIEEQWTRDPEWRYNDNAYVVAEAMRQDAALLRAFVAAECRLLLDMGLEPGAVERVGRALEQVLLELEPRDQGEVVAERL